MCFKPVYLGIAERAIGQPNRRRAFHFPPSELVAQFLNLKTQSAAGRMTVAGDFGRCVAL
ncbi:MAG: hypothetical protein KKE86_06090 [Planctomycetes bacterium]|nr:hypothetical protein [Planctomycetota bacterium]